MPTDLLGLAGDVVTKSDRPNYDITKIGGHPVLPVTPSLLWETLCCRICGQPSSVVLQAFAPLSAAPQRVLLLFACVGHQCRRKPAAWRCLRLQWPPAATAHQTAASAVVPPNSDATSAAAGVAWLPGVPGTDSAQPSFSASAAKGWEGHLPDPDESFPTDESASGGWCDWGGGPWGAEGGDMQLTDNFDFSDLNEALEVAAAATTAAGGGLAPVKKSSKASAHVAHVAAPSETSFVTVNCGPPFPEFYIYAMEEAASVKQATTPSDDQHIQELIRRYEAEEAAASGRAAMTSSTMPSSRNTSHAVTPDDGLELDGASEISWAPEEYERDHVKGVSPAFLKFSKRLRLQPEQCVRYGRGHTPLWPNETAPPIRQCPHCGSNMIFELQLMPPLIQMLSDAVPMLSDESTVTEDMCQVACGAWMEWDWLTVAVFSCMNSCVNSGVGGGDMVVREEHVVVAYEEEWEQARMP